MSPVIIDISIDISIKTLAILQYLGIKLEDVYWFLDFAGHGILDFLVC